ncbi:conserved hypothetical protein [Planktothrix sp. PCC 11201]|uniref:hypothetical protein n=1 Tax=Planktothrix sp. PCC 11201 TaxID=1729650 RepID=UPI00091C36C9|nr:hypothetical protein [Planktothrix sp. PCC 11201]SKB16017.1 conserved hypothetical protein [Planktothrix sp. PCC 11201]
MTDQHILQETFDSLPKLDYIPLLDTILKEIKTTNTPIFQLAPDDQNRLLIRAYDFAYKIATENKTLNPLTQTNGIRAATVNFEDAAKFCDKIRQIQQLLKEKLNLACQPESPENILAKICSDLGEFNQEKDDLPFNYDFNKQSPFNSKRLILENSFTPHRSNGSDAIIKAHHFNIRFTGLADFQDNLCAYIRHHIETITDEDSPERRDLNELFNELLARPDSSLNNLRSIIDQEALPRLLRDLKIDYLEYLKKGWQKTHPNVNSPDLTLLQTLINRLKIVIEYVNDPNLDNAHYDITYLGETVNLRTAFSQSDAFDSLPIIPDYQGVMGESYNRNSNNFKEFNLGIRLKLNGSVSAYNEKSSLDYHIAEIDPTSPRHREYLQNSNKAKSFKTRVLKTVCLYYLIFAIDETGNTPDEEYNPILQFEQEVLKGFQSHQTNPEAITQLLSTIKNKIANSGWEVNQKVNRLKSFLQNFLMQKTVLNCEQKTVKLRLYKDILHEKPINIINSQNFFKINLEDDDTSRSRSSGREALAYLKVEENQLSQDSLASLEVTFTFDDVRYFTVEEEQKFALRYNIDGIKALPVVFYPIRKLNAEEIKKPGEKFKPLSLYDKHFKEKKLIAIYYNITDLRETIFKDNQSPEARIYRQVFSLLTYLCISVCQNPLKDQNLFIPILRFHVQSTVDDSEDEKYLRTLTRSLAHILRRDCLANDQGLNTENKGIEYRTRNALSSLYCLLPKRFKFNSDFKPQLDKLAIIVVSSWVSDAVWNEPDKNQRISNIYGEIVLIERDPDKSDVIQINNFKTFSSNEKHEQLYQKPTVIRDEITKLYEEKGYRHFLYVAKAPYSRRLGLIRSESDPDSLFFMSETVIKYLKDEKPDLKLYPVFMDTYPALNLNTKNQESFYIPDVEELKKLSNDPSQRTKVFLNLFTGVTVDKKRTIFNSVVCYSTLLNIYDDEHTRDVISGLLDDSSPLQKTILNYIILFHFSRYEKSYNNNTNIVLKLNPYSKLIGDEGLGTLSSFTYSPKNINFNTLAFLTMVRSAIYD